jgi:RNA-binding protein
MTSKERAELRAQANTLDTILTVGKGGVNEALVAETEKLLDARELVKGSVLDSALLSAREVSDALCAATGAEGIQTVGSKFVIYRKNDKPKEEKKKAPKPVRVKVKKINPVSAGVRERKRRARDEKQKRKQYFHDAAVKAAIEKRKQQREF